MYGGVDDTQRGHDIRGVQRMQLQGDEDGRESGARVPEQRAVM